MKILTTELDASDKKTVDECLKAAEQEEIFPEWEFDTLFGISRKQLSTVRNQWPDVDIHDPNVGAAVIGAMNHLLGYPHMQGTQWKKYVSVGPDAIKLTLEKLLSLGM